MKILLRLCALLSLLVAMSWAMAADKFSQAEAQIVRSVLERQNTLMRLNAVAMQRAATESVRALAKTDSDQQSQLRLQLLVQARALGMSGVEGLQAPGYFQRAEAQLQTLNGAAFDRQYLLLALQCHAFLERSLNAELRSGGAAELAEWVKTHIDTFEQQSRSIDHALYDLK